MEKVDNKWITNCK